MMTIEELVTRGEEFATEIWKTRNELIAGEVDTDFLPLLIALHDDVMLGIAHLNNGYTPEFPGTLEDRLRWAIKTSLGDPDNSDVIYNLSLQAGLTMLTIENALNGNAVPRSSTLRKLEVALDLNEGFLDV